MSDTFLTARQKINEIGFAIIEKVYTKEEICKIITVIDNADQSKDNFRKSTDLFAIRQFLKEIPAIQSILFNSRLKELIRGIFGNDFFAVKSIYFDKPVVSNWYVAYHQDLTISVDKKMDIEGFGPWTVKQNQFAVQPPIAILQDNFTLRFHLDDTDENNGALRVIEGSHRKGVYRPETIDWKVEKEITCTVKSGGVMLMKPLLLHSSGRTTSNKRRRVIHIEFSNAELPPDLQWSEKLSYDSV